VIAIILAAGLGTRLRPLTLYRPKPLINYRKNTLIGHQIEKLLAANVAKIHINTAHGQLMHDYLVAAYPDAPITIFQEPFLEPFGTHESIRKMIHHYNIDEPFILISADIYTDFDYQHLTLSGHHDGIAWLIADENHSDFGIKNDLLTSKGYFTYANIGIYQPHVFQGPSKDFRGALLAHQIKTQQLQDFWQNVGDYPTIVQ